jgi:Ca-activated chloride channel family protein
MNATGMGLASRAAAVGAVLLAVGVGIGQPASRTTTTTTTRTTTTTTDFTASNIVVPQRGCFLVRPDFERVVIQGVEASVDILEQVATTTLKVTVHNPAARQLEAEMMVPVPDGSTIRSFAFDGVGGKEAVVRLLPRDEARRTYESIVRAARDPALLEFANSSLVRSSVFPVPAGGTTTLTLVYEGVLNADGNRVDYVLPRTQALEAGGVAWKVTAKVRTKRPISTVYSPSHEIVTKKEGTTSADVTLSDAALRQPGSFRLSYMLEGAGVTASLMAYPDPEIGGGYFLLLAGVPAEADQQKAEQLKREIMIVLDRSGSMRGEKIEQARAAAVAILEGLENGEAFNVVDYSDTIAMFSEQPVVKDAKTLADARAYVNGLAAGGGTNIHDALLSAVRQRPSAGMLPMVLFMTDGLATVGNTSEVAIRNDTAQANAHKRRIFTFGVGYDVNAPLLDRLAESARGTSLNVLPGENVESAVSSVFRRLQGPVVAEPRLVALGADGAPSTRAVHEQMPGALPDLFEGDQLVVLGQYRDADNGRLKLRLEGEFRGAPRVYEFDFKLDGATTRNDFVPRLWATRKIAMLVDEIRQRGAEAPSAATPGDPGHADARTKELVDEIVRLSTKFGILTEYTSFLATEPDGAVRDTQLSFDAAGEEATKKLQERAVEVRAGLGAVNQSLNVKVQQTAACTNLNNEYWNANMERVSVSTVQQIYDQALFLRNGCWVDSRIASQEMAKAGATAETPKADRTVDFGSDAYFELARTLADQGRPGIMALRGEVLVLVNGERVLVKGAGPEKAADGK